ncbi:MAG: UDP-N-acetylmuramate dehydrogenase [Verrucomicrobia bacterium]|nr:UDP-N-acetylmuramate dehydrogenase [Verrucomicrobiota bacterium]
MQPSLEIERSKILAPFTTFGIGGPAEQFVIVRTFEEMSQAMYLPRPHFILGKGSNCLFDDRGFSGSVILNRIDLFEDLGQGRFRAGAGMALPLLSIKTAKGGWSGLEFACGIPGSVGGAVVMNAGASGKEIADVLESVEVVDQEGRLQFFRTDQLHFSYRTSPFQQEGGGAVVAATFQLFSSVKARGIQLANIKQRKETQPLGEKSAGCIFRNLPTVSAGQLIDHCGLKGLSVGDAVVSDVHANFIVNRGRATSSDVQMLIEKIRGHVLEKTGHLLYEEVRKVPYVI